MLYSQLTHSKLCLVRVRHHPPRAHFSSPGLTQETTGLGNATHSFTLVFISLQAALPTSYLAFRNCRVAKTFFIAQSKIIN